MRLAPMRRSELDRHLPLRIRPDQGRPRCLAEQLAQHIWTHKLAWYIAATVTLILALQLGLGPDLHRWIYR